MSNQTQQQLQEALDASIQSEEQLQKQCIKLQKDLRKYKQ